MEIVYILWGFTCPILLLVNFTLFMHYANNEPKWLYRFFYVSLFYSLVIGLSCLIGYKG